MTQQLLRNARVATCQPNSEAYGWIEQGAIAIEGGEICWCGPDNDIPDAYRSFDTRDLESRLVTPALIDCHTHIVHGGHRAREFEQRLTGVSYEEIARQGGGIISTVTATRAASVDDLVQSALPRVDSLLAEGVAVLEIKSGYGLDTDTELNMLRAAKQISEQRPVKILKTFLGAHAVPANYKDRAADYITEVCIPTLDQAFKEGLVDAVDGFCESIAFTTTELEPLLQHATSLGLPIKLHAEQLTLSGGTELAARFNALSADHLEYLDEAGVKALKSSDSVATLLPGAFYTLRETQLPPIEHLRHHNVPIAIATDANPGSSPLTSLLLAMNMSCTLFRMTPEEALLGTTRHAAKALGLGNYGCIASGMRAALAIWNVSTPAELCYRVGFNPLHERIVP